MYVHLLIMTEFDCPVVILCRYQDIKILSLPNWLFPQIFKKYESLAAQDEVKRQKLLQDRAAQLASSRQQGS